MTMNSTATGVLCGVGAAAALLLIASGPTNPDYVIPIPGTSLTVSQVTVANAATNVVTADGDLRSITIQNIGGTNDVYCTHGTAAGHAATTANGILLKATNYGTVTIDVAARNVAVNCITNAATSVVALILEK